MRPDHPAQPAEEAFPPVTPPSLSDPPSGSATEVFFDEHQSSWRQQQLERELCATRSELEALQALLDELPEIFERKFQSRLQPILEQQHHLLQDNAALRQQLLGLQPQPDRTTQRGPVLLPSVAQLSDNRRTGLRSALHKVLPWRRRQAA